MTSDKKMLTLIEILKELNIIRFTKEFCVAAGILEQNLRNIKTGYRNSHFRPYHIKNICEEYNVNANWIFGLSDDVFNDSELNKQMKELFEKTT